MQEKLMEICAAFRIPGRLSAWEELKVGNINKTYKVTFTRDNGFEKTYIVQQLNTHVFKNPEQVMENIERVTRHLRELRPGQVNLHFHHTREGKNFVWEGEHFWRLFNYVPSADATNDRDETLVRNAGAAFGDFQNALSGFDPSQLHETIPDFHNTIKRYEALEAAVQQNPAARADEAKQEIQWLMQAKDKACMLCSLMENGEIPLRVTHNDTKVNNVLFDQKDKRALVVIDLDTVMPGLAGNDFGDAIRYVSNMAAEDEKDVGKVSCDLQLFHCFAEGFLEKTAKSFTAKEIETFGASCFSMTVEVAVRFLTDYLQGDTYFHCAYPEHNLVRTRAQIALAQDMQRKMDEMNRIVAECAAKYRA